MYGREHLEWCEKQAVAEKIDNFMAGLSAHERKYALAILRERHTVYKDGGGLGDLLRQHANTSQLQAILDRERQRQSGGVLSIFGL